MKIKHAKMLINKIDEIAEKDGDVFIACYFSACDDKYHGTVVNADVFDYKIMCDHVSKLLVPGIVMRAKRHIRRKECRMKIRLHDLRKSLTGRKN